VGALITRILSGWGSFASIVGLIFTLQIDIPAWGYGLIALGIFLLGLQTFLEISEYRKSKPKFCRTAAKANRFLKDWIDRPGRVLVFTRDMSWAEGDILTTLQNKAARRELTVFMQGTNAHARSLEDAGATVYFYGPLAFVPESRFTIINEGRMDAKVAIGISDTGGSYRIYRFQKGHDLLFNVASDLANLMQKAHDKALLVARGP
jgi:hypothetical protein